MSVVMLSCHVTVAAWRERSHDMVDQVVIAQSSRQMLATMTSTRACFAPRRVFKFCVSDDSNLYLSRVWREVLSQQLEHPPSFRFLF